LLRLIVDSVPAAVIAEPFLPLLFKNIQLSTVKIPWQLTACVQFVKVTFCKVTLPCELMEVPVTFENEMLRLVALSKVVMGIEMIENEMLRDEVLLIAAVIVESFTVS